MSSKGKEESHVFTYLQTLKLTEERKKFFGDNGKLVVYHDKMTGRKKLNNYLQ